MAKTRAIRIKIGDATFTMTEVQTRVEKPSLVPDADPADLIAETAGEAEREAMFARLDAAHSRFIDAMGADGRKVRRMTIRGYGTPKGGDSQGFQYIPPDWLNLKNALCDKWTMNLAKEDGSPWRLSVVLLTPAGLVTSITGGAYEGLGFRPFHVDETLRIVETEARGGPVDRKDKGLKGTSCYALLVSVAMEQGFAVAPEMQVVARPKQGNTLWPAQAQERVAELWVSFRSHGGTRERDCYEEHKNGARMPDCVTTFQEFRKCKDAAKKRGLIPPMHPKRGKSAGNRCQ